MNLYSGVFCSRIPTWKPLSLSEQDPKLFQVIGKTPINLGGEVGGGGWIPHEMLCQAKLLFKMKDTMFLKAMLWESVKGDKFCIKKDVKFNAKI